MNDPAGRMPSRHASAAGLPGLGGDSPGGDRKIRKLRTPQRWDLPIRQIPAPVDVAAFWAATFSGCIRNSLATSSFKARTIVHR